jgi:hypothetical protein
MHAHFVLSDLPLRLWQWALLLLVCTLPLVGLGFTGRLMLALDQLSREHKSEIRRVEDLPWRVGRSAGRHAIALGLLTGLGGGMLIVALLSTGSASLLPAASLPMLLLAVIAGRSPDFPPAVAATKANLTHST